MGYPYKKMLYSVLFKKFLKNISKKIIRSIFRPFLPKKEFCGCCPFCEVTIWTIKTRFVAFASELSALQSYRPTFFRFLPHFSKKLRSIPMIYFFEKKNEKNEKVDDTGSHIVVAPD